MNGFLDFKSSPKKYARFVFFQQDPKDLNFIGSIELNWVLKIAWYTEKEKEKKNPKEKYHSQLTSLK